MFEIASAMSDRRDRWRGHGSDELHLDSLIAAPHRKLRASPGLGVRVLARKDNCGSVTSALGKEPFDCVVVP